MRSQIKNWLIKNPKSINGREAILAFKENSQKSNDTKNTTRKVLESFRGVRFRNGSIRKNIEEKY